MDQGERERTLRAVTRCVVTGPDPLAEGNLGRIDFLWTASRRLKRRELGLGAFRQAALLVARKECTGSYYLQDPPGSAPGSPGLLHGLAGIGYQLLRLGDPKQLPTLLLLEA